MGEPVTDPFPEIRINTASRTARKASASRQSSSSSVLSAPLLVVVLALTAALLLFGGFLSKARSKSTAKGRQSSFARVQGSTTPNDSQNRKPKRTRSSTGPSEQEKHRYAQGWERGVNEGTHWKRNLVQAVESRNDLVAEACLENIAKMVNLSIRDLNNADRNVKMVEQRMGGTHAGSPASDYVDGVRAGRAWCLGHYEGLMSVVGKYVQ